MEKHTLPVPESTYRSFSNNHERIGIGFMDKSNFTDDFTNYRSPTWAIIFVLRGNGSFVDHQDLSAQHPQGRSYALAAGDCFMRLPGHQHSNHIDPDSQWFEAFLDIGPQLASALITARIITNTVLVQQSTLDHKQIKRLANMRTQLHEADESELGRCCLNMQRFINDNQCDKHSAHTSNNGNGSDPIEAACRLLSQASLRRDNLRDWVLTQKLDYDIFRKEFKRRIGISPGQYRIRRRMDHACELLHHSDLSISAIAYELGYPTPYEFSAQFKIQKKMSPSQYRG